MPVFPKPTFVFDYDVGAEISRLRKHKKLRGIPKREKDKFLVATWNVANLGAQQRRNPDRTIIAEIMSWFDIIAVQECRENFADLFAIQNELAKSYRIVMSDVAGNDERMAFVYDSRKLTVLEEIGEIAFPPSRYKSVKLPGINRKFDGFDRTPYLAAFSANGTSLMLVNVHLYYGDDSADAMARRSLETFAVAKWADQRRKSLYSFTRELVVLGDFNMPKSQPGDPIFKALTRLGLELPEHSTQIASNIADDANYDQIAFLPETTRNCFTGRKGVFDYDTVIFPDLWGDGNNMKDFRAYLRYYISDHRPMWVQLSTQQQP
ncbi:MAG TPA: endonuclease/exonuclease/phosphatase family protein [Sedimentisphaerales bacterium]|nr:endonuclease/exonuclease/phosphatase family protein [Sedimentisphaerales bacterium]